MEELGKPVPESIKKLDKLINETMGKTGPVVDFSNTKIAFGGKTDKELKKTAWLFKLMNNPLMVNVGSKLGLLAVKLRLPFSEYALKETIYSQFVGGTTLLETQKVIDRLYKNKSYTILDYGAEGKETEEDLNNTLNETLRAIDFAGENQTIPVVSTKITGLASNSLLEKIQTDRDLDDEEKREYRSVLKRVDALCSYASQKDVILFFDAEESWMQDSIDHLVNMMMKRYNRHKAIVYNTFQMYRHDRLQFLIDSHDTSKKQGYILGAKLVRGAYMEKERERAYENNYDSPIHPNKAATDDAFNTALRFCIDNLDHIALCNATHNADSNRFLAETIVENSIDRNHPHLMFAQLMGMSDNITFNLADAGFYVGKYVPYGPVRDVVPYLIRRANENTAVTGDMSREYGLVNEELKRRGLK